MHLSVHECKRFYLAGNPEAEHAETEQKRGHPPHHHEDEEEEKEGNNMFSGFDSDFLSQVLKVKDSTIRKIQSPDDNNRKQIIKVKGGLSIIRPPLKPSEAREEEEETRHESGGRRRRHGEKRVEEEEEEEEEVEEEPTGRRKHREWRRERTHRKGEREGEGEEEEVVEEEETETKTRGERGERERERRTRDSRGEKSNYINNNALEETICTLKLQENIADPSRADVFNPRAGRITTANSLTLPVLKRLHLSAQWVNLYKNGIFVPHWNMNANSVIFVTRGRGRIQVVNFNGKSVFNGEVKRGQLLVVPQNFAVAKQAGKEGLEYIAFKTNDRAEISTMVGRDSAISATPAEVLAHAFGLTLQEVNALKNNRNEGVLATPDSRIPDDHYITTVV